MWLCYNIYDIFSVSRTRTTRCNTLVCFLSDAHPGLTTPDPGSVSPLSVVMTWIRTVNRFGVVLNHFRFWIIFLWFRFSESDSLNRCLSLTFLLFGFCAFCFLPLAVWLSRFLIFSDVIVIFLFFSLPLFCRACCFCIDGECSPLRFV